jgi:hypothetical protein
LFEDGHRPATAAAPQGWEHVRTVTGLDGFVAAQFLTAQGLPGGPREQPDLGPGPASTVGPGGVETGPTGGPLGPGEVEPPPLNVPVKIVPPGGEGGEGIEVPVTILTPEERADLGQLGDIFQGAPPRRGTAFFSPSIGARAPAYGQTMFVQPRARFAGFGAAAPAPRLRSVNYQLARALRIARSMSAPQVLAEARAAAARGDTMIAHALLAVYAQRTRRRTFSPSPMRG